MNPFDSCNVGQGLVPDMKNWKHDAPASCACWNTDLSFMMDNVAPTFCFMAAKGRGFATGCMISFSFSFFTSDTSRVMFPGLS
jgi:hypothetical protein